MSGTASTDPPEPTGSKLPDGTAAKRAQRRAQWLDAMADHLLAHGLAGSPLRALAAAAGTSDRMLLYYFSDRDDLLAALLRHVAQRMTDMLAGFSGPLTAAQMLAQLWDAARAPAFEPYMSLFMELAAAAGRGEEPHRTAASDILAGFGAWTRERLSGEVEEAEAMLLLATLDGLFLLHCSGQRDAAAAAARVAIDRLAAQEAQPGR